jgi:type I restriction enzyme M protein
METEDIKKLLEALNFRTDDGDLYTKNYAIHRNYRVSVKFSEKRIYYRDDDITCKSSRVKDSKIQVGDYSSSNFEKKENFVVLECVDRLLNKGYSPNDIYLEKKYTSGRLGSGGKCDICVYDKYEKSFILIECKTYGKEFNDERVKMEEDGGQLFSYFMNDRFATFLVLYTSYLSNDCIVYDNYIIRSKDRREDEAKSEEQLKEENIKRYKDAGSRDGLYLVWRDYYNMHFHFNGIFDDDAIAYSIDLKPLKKRDLKPLKDVQGLFKKYVELLRHNNISDNANAFNKMLSLFLCKIVDEEKNDDETLSFQVIGDEEYENTIDRLQVLYKKGMEKLNEDIIYYSEEDVNSILTLYRPESTIQTIKEIFRTLKYYTNSEFAFKNVYNNKLFRENGHILSETIKLLQNYKISYDRESKTVNEFFEMMLYHGVRQSDGQYFTPMPLVRFILLSLCFEKIIDAKIANNKNYLLPRILDYACGAGHFLTESIEVLKNVVANYDTSNLTEDQKSTLDNYCNNFQIEKDSICGIEKDYRLARTSQISCYLHGVANVNIFFGEGLQKDTINDNDKYDIVVANPPYSVRGFKKYLNVEKRDYDLYDKLQPTSKEIEVLYIERTKQVLEDNGLAGIILPSTILTNEGIYQRARRFILKYFEIKSITKLGNNTFLESDIVPVILFLKRRNDNFLKDREVLANNVFGGTFPNHLDGHLDASRFVKLFCDFRGFDLKCYTDFLNGNIDSISTTTMFKEYLQSFQITKDYKKIQSKNDDVNSKIKKLLKLYYNYCKLREQDKFLFFMLCHGNGNNSTENAKQYYSQKTLVVNTGTKKNEQVEYLGYDFKTKGSKRINIIRNGGKLYDNTNLDNPEKATKYIREAINDEVSEISKQQKNNIAYFNLTELIDFNSVLFEIKIKTNTTPHFPFITKYDQLEIRNITEYTPGKWEGKIPPLKQVKVIQPKCFLEDGKIDYAGLDSISIEEQKLKEMKLVNNDIIIEISGGSDHKPVGRVVKFENIPDTSDEITFGNYTYRLRVSDDNVLSDYLFIVLNYIYDKGCTFLIQNGATGIKNLDIDEYLKIRVPIPPICIQQQVIDVTLLNQAYKKEIIDKIEKLKKDILSILHEAISQSEGTINLKMTKLNDVVDIKVGDGPNRENPRYWENGTIYWFTSKVCKNCYIDENTYSDKMTNDGFDSSSCHMLPPNTVLYVTVGDIGSTAYLKIQATTNQNVAGLIPKNQNELNSKYLFYLLIDKYIKEKQENRFTYNGKSHIADIEIPLLASNAQNDFVSKVEEIEKEIDKHRLELESIKQANEIILKKYLESIPEESLKLIYLNP